MDVLQIGQQSKFAVFEGVDFSTSLLKKIYTNYETISTGIAIHSGKWGD